GLQRRRRGLVSRLSASLETSLWNYMGLPRRTLSRGTMVCQEVVSDGDSRLMLQFILSKVAGAPQIPACHRAPWSPTFAALLHRGGLGQVGGRDFVRWLQSAEGQRKALAHAVVAHWQDVGTAEAEDQKHLHRPAPDAAHLSQMFDDCLVRHAPDARQRGDGAVEGLRGQVAQSEGF